MRCLLTALLVLGFHIAALSATEDPTAHAQDLVRDGKFSAALKELEPFLEGDKDNLPARMTAVAACLGLGQPECAQRHLKWVAASSPPPPGYQLLRGRTLLLQAAAAAEKKDKKRQQSLASDAADAFAKVLAETPGKPTNLALRAMALRAAGRATEAREAYFAWIAADPRNADAYGATAALYAETGTWAETGALIARAPQDDPKLLQAVRVAVLRNGFTVIPWATLRPMFDSVEAAETDPAVKQALGVYRSILQAPGVPSLLALLDYLDVDPDDRLNVRETFLQGFPPADWESHLESAEGVKVPERITHAEPVYPDIARRARIEGIVIFLVRIRKDGTVGSVHVLWSSNPMFVKAARDAVAQWRYSPATKNGEAFEVPFFVRVDFRLE